MELLERGKNNEGIQTLRLVVDVIDRCNLSCDYCLANYGWSKDEISAQKIEEIFKVAEKRGILEVSMSGGEITMHPDFFKILDLTHLLNKTVVTFVTNATNINTEIVRKIKESNVSRIGVSLDGPNEEIHSSRRGKNFNKVLDGLKQLQETSKRLHVISVAHSKNYNHIIELSNYLVDKKLVKEHHICCVSSSGNAKKSFDKYALSEDQVFALQNEVDKSYQRLLDKGLYVMFSSFWALTGKRSKSQSPRTALLAQLAEQTKNIFIVTRPNGDVRTSLSSWGRETVGNLVIGNLNNKKVEDIFEEIDIIYKSGKAKQLPREVEAGYKFNIGPFKPKNNNISTPIENQLLNKGVNFIPVRELSEIDLLKNKINDVFLKDLAIKINLDKKRFRLIKHSSGVFLSYDRTNGHTTLLKEKELSQLINYINVSVRS